jgi:hypothetical protein
MPAQARDQLITKWSKEILQQLQALLPSKPTEADFRQKIDLLLGQFCSDIGVNPLPHVEYTLAKGRADAVFNRLIIEYERPGRLKANVDAGTRHAIQQVKDYLTALAKKSVTR